MHPGRLPVRIPVALQTVYLPLTPASTPSERLCKIARTPRAARPPDADTLTPVIRHQPSRRALRAVFVLAAFASLLVATAPAASAAPSCGRQVIDDWYDNGRIDGTYALHCYDDAIEILPRDVRDYSSAKEDIERALQAQAARQPAPPATTDPSPDGGTSTDPSTAPPIEATRPEEPAARSQSARSTARAPARCPIPLLILAGLALLLVAGGSAGYVDPAVPEPPAPAAGHRPSAPTGTLERAISAIPSAFPGSVRRRV